MTDPILDPARFTQLRRIGGQDLITQLIDTFAAEAPARRAALAQAHATGDLTALADAAHILVAGGGQLGAVALAAEARAVEEAARGGNASGALARAPTLLTTFDAALAALAQAREAQ